MSERTMLLGLLSEKKEEITRIKIKLDGLIKDMRYHLNPFDAIDNLDLETAREYLKDAIKLKRRYLELTREIKKIEKELGR